MGDTSWENCPQNSAGCHLRMTTTSMTGTAGERRTGFSAGQARTASGLTQSWLARIMSFSSTLPWVFIGSTWKRKPFWLCRHVSCRRCGLEVMLLAFGGSVNAMMDCSGTTHRCSAGSWGSQRRWSPWSSPWQLDLSACAVVVAARCFGFVDENYVLQKTESESESVDEKWIGWMYAHILFCGHLINWLNTLK